MPYALLGDQCATHPLLMALYGVRGADERTTNEVTGFILRCATQSAGHMTDYVIDLGTAVLLGGGRHELLLRQAVEAGLVRVEGRGAKRRWVIVQDADFVHIRFRADVEWERQRTRDTRNKDLTMPVRLRDGDVCRYCGVIVNWGARRGGRAGTYDHRVPGQEAKSPDDLVVSCRECNQVRGDRDHADELRPLRPAPTSPYFSPHGKRTSLDILRDYYWPDPSHWIHTYINPDPHERAGQPVEESTGSGMEDHAATESTSSTWEAHGAAESTAPKWARPSTSSDQAPGGEEAHGPAERTNARPEARRGAGSTATAEEAHDRPRRTAAARRARRRRAHGQDD